MDISKILKRVDFHPDQLTDNSATYLDIDDQDFQDMTDELQKSGYRVRGNRVTKGNQVFRITRSKNSVTFATIASTFAKRILRASRISESERTRFYAELERLLNTKRTFAVFPVSQSVVLHKLQDLGWAVVKKSSNGLLLEREGAWPLLINELGNGTRIRLSQDDSRWVDPGSETDDDLELARMAKILLPSGRQKGYGEWTWSKNGMGAAAQNRVVSTTKDKAKRSGFKPLDQRTGLSPDGSYMNSGTVFVNGPYLLTIRSGYGSTKYGNRLSITLTFDLRRGI